jgi:hypothetical protein
MHKRNHRIKDHNVCFRLQPGEGVYTGSRKSHTALLNNRKAVHMTIGSFARQYLQAFRKDVDSVSV